MINFKNILRLLLMSMFICVLSGEVSAQSPQMVGFTSEINWDTSGDIDRRSAPNAVLSLSNPDETRNKLDLERNADIEKKCDPACKDGENCVSGRCETIKATGGGGQESGDFCSGDFGLFSSLVRTGQIIFQRLRDLIYVVAGFGIIAVAVGGLFGNLNWKWLGAIVISLVVIATAGELIVLVTGCEQFGATLITNTLTNPTAMSPTEYMEQYTVEDTALEKGEIEWNDEHARKSTSGIYDAKKTIDEEGTDGWDYDGADVWEDYNPYAMGYKN